ESFQAGFPVRRHIYFIAAGRERLPNHVQDWLFVVYHEDSPADTFTNMRSVRFDGHVFVRRIARLMSDRQFNHEGGTLTRLAARRDGATMFFDDAVAQAQAETRAFSHLLGGKKWIENFG